MKPLTDCKLYAFVDTAYLRGRAPELVAQQLCNGGADLIQLRAKTSTPGEIRTMAGKVLPISRKATIACRGPRHWGQWRSPQELGYHSW